jgi:hypothetical protein
MTSAFSTYLKPPPLGHDKGTRCVELADIFGTRVFYESSCKGVLARNIAQQDC